MHAPCVKKPNQGTLMIICDTDVMVDILCEHGYGTTPRRKG